jgi:hypothetical protein
MGAGVQSLAFADQHGLEDGHTAFLMPRPAEKNA